MEGVSRRADYFRHLQQFANPCAAAACPALTLPALTAG